MTWRLRWPAREMRRLRRFSRRMSMKKVRTTTMQKVASRPRIFSTDSRGSVGDLTISTGMGRWREGVVLREAAADELSGCAGEAARSLLISFMVSEALLSAVLLDQGKDWAFWRLLDLYL